jgi:excisionase family DNA binding protein
MTLSQKMEMATWVRRSPWTGFCTLTFRKVLSAETCSRIFLDWIAGVEQREGKSIQWARMIERGKTTGRLHIHALIAGPRGISLQTAEQLWQRLAGTATIRAYDPERRGPEYMLKSMEDNADADFDFSLAQRRQQSGKKRNEGSNDGANVPDFPSKNELISVTSGSSPCVEFEALLSATEAARLLRMHPVTLLRWAREGRVPHHRLSRKVFFRASELDAWCAEGFKMTTTVRAAQL